KRFPKASLEVITMRDWTIYEWLSLGRIDIGVLCDPPASPAIDAVPIRKHELFLVSSAFSGLAPKTRDVAFKDLHKYPLILPGEPHTLRTLLEATAAKYRIKLNVALQIEGGNFIMDLVDQGHGCAILTGPAVQAGKLTKRLQTSAIVAPRLAR